MAMQVVTQEDLQKFKTELLSELLAVLSPQRQGPREWLRSSDVRKMLGISSGTLQKLRIDGDLKYSKINGSVFYLYKDVDEMLSNNKQNQVRL